MEQTATLEQIPKKHHQKTERITTTAPSRIDLAGGTTDIEFFINDPRNKEGGSTLNAAISLNATVTATESGEKGLILRSSNRRNPDGDTAHVYSINDLEDPDKRERFGLFHSIMNYTGFFPEGYLIDITATAPPGSGLGSSAAVGVAFVGALEAIKDPEYKLDDRTRKLAAETAIQAEWAIPIVGGKQDQYAAAYGRVRRWRFKENDTDCLPLDRRVNKYLTERLFICYTGVSHFSGDTNGKQKDRYLAEKLRDEETKFEPYQGNGRMHTYMEKIRQVAEDMTNLLMEKEFDDAEFINLLNKETDNRKELHEDTVTERMKQVIKAADRYGAKAVKILGAGGGGSLLFYVDPAQSRSFVKGMVRRGEYEIIPYHINTLGLTLRRESV